MRTIDISSSIFRPLEDAIRHSSSNWPGVLSISTWLYIQTLLHLMLKHFCKNWRPSSQYNLMSKELNRCLAAITLWQCNQCDITKITSLIAIKVQHSSYSCISWLASLLGMSTSFKPLRETLFKRTVVEMIFVSNL